MKKFPPAMARAIDAIKYLRIRSGDHRFIPVWVVVVDGRPMVRTWNDEPDGWYRAFLKEPSGAILVGKREVAIQAVPVIKQAELDAASEAYPLKYNTRANEPYTKGLRLKSRAKLTLELVPAATTASAQRKGGAPAKKKKR